MFPALLAIGFRVPAVMPVVLATHWLNVANKGVTVEEGGLQKIRRELASTLLKGDFPFPSSGEASRERMSASRECHLLRIMDHMVFVVQIASYGE